MKAPLWHQRVPLQNYVLYVGLRRDTNRNDTWGSSFNSWGPTPKALLQCTELFLQSFPALELASPLIFILSVNYTLTEEPEINSIFIFGFLGLFRSLSSEWNHFLPASSEDGCRPELDLKREAPLHSWLCVSLLPLPRLLSGALALWFLETVCPFFKTKFNYPSLC